MVILFEDRVRQVLLFFLCTRFLCPLLITVDSKTAQLMQVSKDLGALVNSSVPDDLSLLEAVLEHVIEAPCATVTEETPFPILDSFLGLGVKV